MARIKMTPTTYKGMRIRILVDVKKYAPFDNEFFAKAGDVGIVQKTIGNYHYVKFGNGLPVQVKISDTEIVY